MSEYFRNEMKDNTVWQAAWKQKENLKRHIRKGLNEKCAKKWNGIYSSEGKGYLLNLVDFKAFSASIIIFFFVSVI